MTKADVDLDGARLSSDRSRRRLAVRPGGISKQLAFSAGPVFQRIAGSAAALQVNVVGAQRDFLSSWTANRKIQYRELMKQGTPPKKCCRCRSEKHIRTPSR